MLCYQCRREVIDCSHRTYINMKTNEKFEIRSEYCSPICEIVGAEKMVRLYGLVPIVKEVIKC
jgi:hypothetical protein